MRKRNRNLYAPKRAPFVGRFFRRRLGLEQLCDECSRPYLPKNAAPPIEKLVSGSAVATVFVEERFGKRTFYVQFGRYAADGNQMYVSPMVTGQHLEDIARVALMARSYIREQKPLRLVSRG